MVKHLFPVIVCVVVAVIRIEAKDAMEAVEAMPMQAYTNHAGHAIIGELVAVDAKNATFRLASGVVRKVALAAFPPSERERIGIDSGTLAPPPAVAEAFDRCRQALRRVDVLVAAGQQSSESASQSRELERGAVVALIEDLKEKGKLSSAAAIYFVERAP